MHQRDRLIPNGLYHLGTGYTLVVRPPGACRITVPAKHHFLDIHLGKSDASYEISGLESMGDTAPPASFVFIPANGQREIVAIRSGWSVQTSFDPKLLQTHMASAQRTNDTGDEHLGLRAICHAEDDPMIGITQQLSGFWIPELPTPTTYQLEAIATLLVMRVGHHVVIRDPRPPKTPFMSKRIQSVLDHIESNLGASHSLDSLAEVAGVSTYHFARMFRQATGRSPHQYVIERRLAHAKRRLRNSDDPIVAIAHECGFGSQSHMTDVFSKILGTTPGAIRREAP